MGIIFYLIIILCIAIFVFIGYKKGLAGSLFKFASFILAIILSMVLYNPISHLIMNNTELDESIKESIVTTFSSEEESAENEEKESKFKSEIINSVTEEVEKASEDAKNTVLSQTSGKLAESAVKVVALVVVFIVSKLILMIISMFLKGIVKLPVLKQFDKIGGVVLGAVEGVVLVYVVLAVISISSMVWSNNKLAEYVEESSIGGMIYENNIIVKYFIK